MRKISLFMLLCVIMFNSRGLENFISNPKDTCDAAGQSDIVENGSNWNPSVHGYPHASSSGYLDREHGESNLTKGTDKPWISSLSSNVWLCFTLAYPTEGRRLELIPAKESNPPDKMVLSASNDNFQKDICQIRTFTKNELHRFWKPGIALAFSFSKGMAAKEFRLDFTFEKPNRVAISKLKLLGIPTKAIITQNTKSNLKFRYDNSRNLVFNPNDMIEPEWKAEINGYPHVSAQKYGQGKCQQGYPYFVNDGYYNRRFWCQNWNEWWPNWLKVDFGKLTEFQYIKFFSTATWIWCNGSPQYVPKEIIIEVSDDNFDKDIHQEMKISDNEILKSWNYGRLDEAKFIKLPNLVKARYVRFRFPGTQSPRRLLVEELEIYKDKPPTKKIERIDLEKPILGGKVKAQILAKTDQALFWVENNIRKVFKKDIPTGNTDNIVELSAAGNEAESFQLVIKPEKQLEKVSLLFSDLTGPYGEKIPASCQKYAFIGYTFVHTPSDVRWRGLENSIGEKGDWPDPLLEEKKLNLIEQRNYPIWITIKTPLKARPGKYSGTIKILNDGKILYTFNLQLRVRNFCIPGTSKQHVTFASNPPIRWGTQIKEKYGDRFSSENIIKAGLNTMVDNGFNTLFSTSYPQYAFPTVTITDNNQFLDFQKFDIYTEFLISLGYKRIEIPFTLSASRLLSRKGYPWNGYAYMSPEYQKYFLGENGYLAQVVKHLKKKEWLKYFELEVSHEPQCAQGFNGWKESDKLVKRIRKLVPDLHLSMGGCYLAQEKEIPNVLKDLDYCSIYPAGFSYEDIVQLRKENPKIQISTWYNGGYLIDFSGINCRILPWLTWCNKMDGYGFYQLIPPIDPWGNSMTFMSFSPYHSTRCGDNMLLYPMCDPNAKQPYWVPSIRLRMACEGNDDFEYLWLLRDRIRMLGKKDGNNAALQAAKKVLNNIEKSIVKRPWKTQKDEQFTYVFTHNPNDVLVAREKVAEQIEILGKILDEK